MASKTLISLSARLLRPTWSRTAVTPAFSDSKRRLHSKGTPPTDENASTKNLLRIAVSTWIWHPFLREGRALMHLAVEYEDKAVIKIDLPGVGRDGLKLWVEHGNVFFEGKEEKDPEAAEDVQPRRFVGGLNVPPGLYDADEAKAFMENGVLKILIPRSGNSRESPLPKSCFELLYRTDGTKRR